MKPWICTNDPCKTGECERCAHDAPAVVMPVPADPLLGLDGKPWPETFDASVWALEFTRRFPAVSIDDAIGWFCNAIMLGYDQACQTAQPSAEPVDRLFETDIYEFAGWLTTRRGTLVAGTSHDAAPMAEAIGEYMRTFPDRFVAKPTAQPLKPLTDAQIEDAFDSVDMRHARGDPTRLAFARAIERAHGIKGDA